MISVTAAFQDITHVLIHVIDSGDDRNDEASTSHNDVHILKRNAFGGHEILDGLMTHVRLIHHGRVFGDILGGVLKLGVKHSDTIGKVAQLRGCGPRVDYKNVSLLRDF